MMTTLRTRPLAVLSATLIAPVDLSRAGEGRWDGPNVGSDGVDDPEKWVVVYQGTYVTVPALDVGLEPGIQPLPSIHLVDLAVLSPHVPTIATL